jgi:acetyl-CoA carboxylase biotin carboxyl carrier protein
MELEDLKELIELLKDTDITELQIEKEGTKVKLRREKIFSPIDMPVQKSPGIHEKIMSETEDEAQRLVTITSPIVGTFYRASEPGAPPFVEKGTRVKRGQVLCIIEAMKLMNEIECDHEGEVVAVYVENGQPVQYGERLFAIKVS